MKKDLLFLYNRKTCEKEVKRVLRLFTWACCLPSMDYQWNAHIITIAINY